MAEGLAIPLARSGRELRRHYRSLEDYFRRFSPQIAINTATFFFRGHG